MITSYIKTIIQQEKQQGSTSLYLRTIAKEYLQVLVLNFLYSNKQYKSNLIFTGGTCLRHLFDLPRLSEDLDFDLLESIDVEQLANELERYFVSFLQYPKIKVSIKQKGKQILLKFPIMKKLGLATKSESDWLYVKIDLSPIIGKSWRVVKTAKSSFGYNFVVTHYDLPSLFTGKISAVLTRNLLTGKEDRKTIKGRDFFDLLWYLKKGVNLNLPLLRERLNQPNLTLEQLRKKLNRKVELTNNQFRTDFKNDLLPFIRGEEFISDYVENYFEEYQRQVIEAEEE